MSGSQGNATGPSGGTSGFSFSGQETSGSTGAGSSGTSLFGAISSTSGSSTPTTSGSNLFGSAPATSGPTAQTSGLFGNSGTSVFGAGNTFGGQTSTGGLFSGGTGFKPATTSDGGNKQDTTPNIFGGLATPNKTSSSQTSGQTQTSSLFGGASFGTGNAFATQSSTSTPPASKPGFSFAAQSTTPAGPPPQTSGPSLFQPKPTAGGGTNMFASIGTSNSTDRQTPSPFQPQGQAASSGSNLFGSLGTTKPQELSSQAKSAAPSLSGGQTQQTVPTGAGSNLFGNIGASKPQDQSTQAKPATPNIFGARQPASTGSGNGQTVFGGQPSLAQNTPAQSQRAQSPLFATQQNPDDQNAAPKSSPFTLGSATPNQAAAGASPFTMGNNNSSEASQGGATLQAPSQQTSSLNPSTTSTGANASSTPNPLGGMFAGLGQKTNDAHTTASGSTPNLFGSFGQKKDDSQPAQSTSTTTSAQTTTAPTSIPSLFTTPASAATAAPPASAAPAGTSSNAASSAPGSSTTATAPPASLTGATGTANLGSSTIGPAPAPQSRLKNKSMDEIITRWASDLSKYQKEFQNQADKVAQWDRMLLDNGNKISKLYNKTFQAERDTAEIQKQLTAVEGHQNELSQWLDRYEREVEDMTARQVGQGEGLQGPDQERERTYKTAERVSERLGEMGKDLTSMIDEINAASATISKTSKQDDPLSQIVRILNSHLSMLQEVDQSASALEARVKAAQKDSQRLGSRGGISRGGRDAEDFYRSYAGNR